MHPNVLRWCTVDLLLCHTSNEVMPLVLFIGHMFSTYIAAFTALPQNHPGRPLAFNMLLAVATTVLFRRLTTPFYCRM
jgi:hypothetical protein